MAYLKDQWTIRWENYLRDHLKVCSTLNLKMWKDLTWGATHDCGKAESRRGSSLAPSLSSESGLIVSFGKTLKIVLFLNTLGRHFKLTSSNNKTPQQRKQTTNNTIKCFFSQQLLVTTLSVQEITDDIKITSSKKKKKSVIKKKKRYWKYTAVPHYWTHKQPIPIKPQNNSTVN